MKKFVIAMLISSAAVAAETTTLTCAVPVEGSTPVINVAVEATEESAGDFLMVTISEPGKELVYYNQLEKGAFREGVAAGQVVTLVIQEGAGMDNGAIRGAGLFVLSKDETGFQGFLSVNNTFYPLVCK